MAIRNIVKESTGLVSDEPLYATLDGRVVAEDDPEANTLVASAGRPIPEKLALRYGLKASGGAKAAEEKPAAEAAPKGLGEETPAVTTRKIGNR